jgi:type VI secretion system secreted protein Hcp
MAADIFAKIGDIKGESVDAKHKDEIEVLSFSWGLTNAGSAAPGGGGGAGKATFQDLSIVHRIDKASPALMLACATGKHLPDATITHRKAGKGQHEYLIVKMNDIIITGVTHGGASGQPDTGSETVSLAFAKVHLEYRPQRPDGSPDTGVHFKYDLKNNKTF